MENVCLFVCLFSLAALAAGGPGLPPKQIPKNPPKVPKQYDYNPAKEKYTTPESLLKRYLVPRFSWADADWNTRDADSDGIKNLTDPCPYSPNNDKILCKQCPLLGLLHENEISTVDANADGIYDSCVYQQSAFTLPNNDSKRQQITQISDDGRRAIIRGGEKWSNFAYLDRITGSIKDLGTLAPGGMPPTLSGDGDLIVVAPDEYRSSVLTTTVGISTPCKWPMLFTFSVNSGWSCHEFDAQGLGIMGSGAGLGDSGPTVSYDGSKVLVNAGQVIVVDLKNKTTALLPKHIYTGDQSLARFSSDGDVIVGHTSGVMRWFKHDDATDAWTFDAEQLIGALPECGNGDLANLADGTRFLWGSCLWQKTSTMLLDLQQYGIGYPINAISDDGRYAIAAHDDPLASWFDTITSTVLDVQTGKKFTLSLPVTAVGSINLTVRLTKDGRWLIKDKMGLQKNPVPGTGQNIVLLERMIAPNPLWTPPTPIAGP